MKAHMIYLSIITVLIIVGVIAVTEWQDQRQVNAMLRDRHPVGFTNDVLTADETQYCTAREKVAEVGIVKFKNGHECSWGIGWTKGQALSNAVTVTGSGSVTITGNCAVANIGAASNVSVTCDDGKKRK
jgi:hypothetical protein